MDQPTISNLEYLGKKRKTRREIFLERMVGLIPWQIQEDRIRPCYPKAGNGRRSYQLAFILLGVVQVLHLVVGPPGEIKYVQLTEEHPCVLLGLVEVFGLWGQQGFRSVGVLFDCSVGCCQPAFSGCTWPVCHGHGIHVLSCVAPSVEERGWVLFELSLEFLSL